MLRIMSASEVGVLARGALAVAYGVLVWGMCAGCDVRDDRERAKPQPPEPSPNASLQPARLTEHDLGNTDHRDAEAPEAEAPGALRAGTSSPVSQPRPWREDNPPDADSLLPRDTAGATLKGQFVWFDVPPPAAVPEADGAAVKQLAEQTTLRVTIDLAAVGRMRLELQSPAFVVAPHTELRSRRESFGHLLVWPGQDSYRVLPVGTLWAVLAERRADVMPLVSADLEPQGEGSWIGLATVRSRLMGPLGELRIEQAEVSDLSSGGELLCRLLVELVGAHPATAGCDSGLVPLRADYHWHEGGRFAFNVWSIIRHHELELGRLLVPPPGSTFRAQGYPRPEQPLIVSAAGLGRIRSKDVAAPPAEAKSAPIKGLVAVNHSFLMKAVLVDGIPIAWLLPGAELDIPVLRPGKYSVGFRDFWGTHVRPPSLVHLPARVVDGTASDEVASP